MDKLEICLKYLLNNGASIGDNTINIKDISLKKFLYDTFQIFGHNILTEFKSYQFAFININVLYNLRDIKENRRQVVYINSDGNIESIKDRKSEIRIYYNNSKPIKYYNFGVYGLKEKYKFKWNHKFLIDEIELKTGDKTYSKKYYNLHHKDKIKVSSYLKMLIRSGELTKSIII